MLIRGLLCTYAFLLCVWCCQIVACLEPYDLPVIPDSIKQQVATVNKIDGKFIPRKGWIAVRNISDEKPKHMLGDNGFINRNSNWDI